MGQIRVLIAEDHDLVRAGFCALLRDMEDVVIVGEAREGTEALEKVVSCSPALVLMDISMPGINGLEVTRRIAEKYPQVKVVILSMHAGEEYVLKALRAGARGYLVKDADTGELALAVRSVNRGGTYLSPRVSRHVIERYLMRQDGDAPEPEILTPRQKEILQMISEGATTKEIAARLDLSIKTVDTHRGQIMERLDIHDIAGLVRYAVRTGLVSAE